MPPKYALDSNLFIDGFRDDREAEHLLAFHERFAPFEYLCAIVMLELRAGARALIADRRLQKHVFEPFERRGRVFAPSVEAWKAAGAALAALGTGASRSFYSDVLIAASCREHGVTLVTRNVRDFARIQGVLRFNFVAAWPA